MNELDLFARKMDLKKLDLLKRIYDARNDKYFFSDTPFHSPEWHGLNDLRPEAQEAEHKHREQFGRHNRFWDDIGENAWRVGLAFSDAVNDFRILKYNPPTAYTRSICLAFSDAVKYNPPTADAYKKAEAKLIKVVKFEYQRAKDAFAIKYNAHGEIRWAWRFRHFVYVISGERWMAKRKEKRLLKERRRWTQKRQE